MPSGGVTPGGGGGTPFNGGTITTPLDIEDASANTTALKVHSVYTDAQGNDTLVVESANSTRRLLLQSDGTTRYDIDSGAPDFKIVVGGGQILRINAGGTELDQNAAITSSSPNIVTLNVQNDGARGYFSVSGASGAPADAALSAGDYALWLDPTNGAAKLMVKAKQTNGTVVTAAIALA